MTTSAHVSRTRTVATPVEVGVKHIRWGLGLFIFGLLVGYIPLAHYMHGSFETVGEAFLKNVTLWWGCAFTLAVYVAQVGSLAMIAIGLCYVVLARDGAMTLSRVLSAWHPTFVRAELLRSLWPELQAITPSPRSGRTSTTRPFVLEYGLGLDCKPSVSRFTSSASCMPTAASNTPWVC